MLLRIWGCRGSLATPGPATVRYGGNTSSVELRPRSGGLVILDGGTGVRPLGLSLADDEVREIDLLLTHMHLDHVEGLGFFAPFFDESYTIRVWGPRPDSASLHDHLAAYLSPPLFPVPFERFPATVTFTEVWEDTWELDGLRVRCAPVSHPGPTVGYRLEEGGRTLAFVPDNEPALDREAGLPIAAGVDLLLHDAQYTAAEYETRVGWGHSALPDFAIFVDSAAPRRTLMFHHDPAHADDTLERMEVKARELTGRDGIELAREGLEISLDAAEPVLDLVEPL
jgi:phosphoribosyl 1,2-cyclic phosphodiesterase